MYRKIEEDLKKWKKDYNLKILDLKTILNQYHFMQYFVLIRCDKKGYTFLKKVSLFYIIYTLSSSS